MYTTSVVGLVKKDMSPVELAIMAALESLYYTNAKPKIWPASKRFLGSKCLLTPDSSTAPVVVFGCLPVSHPLSIRLQQLKFLTHSFTKSTYLHTNYPFYIQIIQIHTNLQNYMAPAAL